MTFHETQVVVLFCLVWFGFFFRPSFFLWGFPIVKERNICFRTWKYTDFVENFTVNLMVVFIFWLYSLVKRKSLKISKKWCFLDLFPFIGVPSGTKFIPSDTAYKVTWVSQLWVFLKLIRIRGFFQFFVFFWKIF